MNKQKIYKITKDIIPSKATHPGLLIADEIKYRGISQKMLAATIQIAPTILNEIIHGHRNLTAILALKLEKALDIDANTWMRLQVKFDIDSLRIIERDKGKHIRAPYYLSPSLIVVREPNVPFVKKEVRKKKQK